MTFATIKCFPEIRLVFVRCLKENSACIYKSKDLFCVFSFQQNKFSFRVVWLAQKNKNFIKSVHVIIHNKTIYLLLKSYRFRIFLWQGTSKTSTKESFKFHCNRISFKRKKRKKNKKRELFLWKILCHIYIHTHTYICHNYLLIMLS